MSAVIERVAKAIRDDRNGSGGTPWGHLPNSHKAPYLSDARAAIEAMREPEEAMLIKGCAIPGVSLETGKRMWLAMINAALSKAIPTDQPEEQK